MEGSPPPRHPATTPAAEVVYLHGQFIPRVEARVDIEDRGHLFADGVYEVLRHYWGKPLAMELHQRRLARSLAALGIEADALVAQLPALSQQLLARNHLTHASIYWQVTRGSAPRNHAIPHGIQPTILAIAYPAHDIDEQSAPKAMTACLMPDQRWARCDIKSLMLLPNILAKTQAKQLGCDEAILTRQGVVTEGSSTTVLAVRSGVLWTHPADTCILPGVTRQLLLELAPALGLPVIEQPIPAHELPHAQEVMLAGTTTHLAAITHVDGAPIGDGRPGQATCQLYTALMDHIRRQCRV